MQRAITTQIGALALGSMLFFAAAAVAQTSDAGHDHSHGHDHGHDHAHEHKDAAQEAIHNGYFEDDQVRDRPLSDWQGDWQSVYPYLRDGTLDPVMAHKAEHGDKTAEEYRAYYETGYKTDVDRITIEGDRVSFRSGDAVVSGQYAGDGHEILTYAKGNRGVRYVFRKTAGDEAAPQFIQFSDHRIAPEKADHYHLYWGDDRAALLQEVTNWPTYYPASLDGAQILAEMMAH